MRFIDRTEAGERLAFELARRGYPDPVVLALPRGGVPVALPIARQLHAPLDLIVARKIDLPMPSETPARALLALDAAAITIDDDSAHRSGLYRKAAKRLTAPQIAELHRRRGVNLSGQTTVPLTGRTVILVDDGLTTGASMRAALRAIAPQQPTRCILALPVADANGLSDLHALADDIICLQTPPHFVTVGAYYDKFDPVTDAEVTAALQADASAKDKQ